MRSIAKRNNSNKSNIVQLFDDIQNVLDNMQLPSITCIKTTVYKIPEESLRQVELAGDDTCYNCGRSGNDCTLCPAEQLMKRLEVE